MPKGGGYSIPCPLMTVRNISVFQLRFGVRVDPTPTLGQNHLANIYSTSKFVYWDIPNWFATAYQKKIKIETVNKKVSVYRTILVCHVLQNINPTPHL